MCGTGRAGDVDVSVVSRVLLPVELLRCDRRQFFQSICT